MPVEALNQAAWAFMQDWMNQKNQAYAMENMKAQQQGWMDYQKEGADLELQRMADMVQGQKEAATFMKYLGLSDEDVPKMLQMMEILGPLGKEIGMPIPEGLTSQVPTLAGRADVLSKSLPALLSGKFEGLDFTTMAQGAGGMQNLIRMLEQGGARANLVDQLPGQRANALANMLSAGGGGKTGLGTDVRVNADMAKLVTGRKNDLDIIYKKFLPSGAASATSDQILSFVMDLMPQDANKKPEEQQAEASRWILGVGLEFFDDLENVMSNIEMRAYQGPLTAMEMRVVQDSASPYRMAMKYKREKDNLVKQFAEKYKATPITDPATGKPLDLVNLFNKPADKLTDLEAKVKDSLVTDIWKAMYGGQ